MADWKKIKAEYVRGVSYKKLSEKYGVSFSSIQKRGASEKWTDLRKKSERKLDEKIVESVAKKEAKRVEVMKDAADKLMDKIVKGIEDDSLIYNSKSIHELTGAIKDLKDILDMRNRLDVSEQEARIAKLRKDAEKNEDESKEVRVVLGGNLEEYAK